MSFLLEGTGIESDDQTVIEIKDDFNELADLISQLVNQRKALGISQKELAAKMETKQSAVSAMESSSANPTINRLQRYARAIGMKISLSAKPNLTSITDLDEGEIVFDAVEFQPATASASEISLKLIEGWTLEDSLDVA